MGAVMGTNALRRSGALNFLSAVGVKVPTNADGSVNTAEITKEVISEAQAKSPALAAVGSFFHSVKEQSIKLKNAVNSLPLPDSVKSIVNDPKKLLSQATQDKLNAMEAAVGIQAAVEAPDAPTTVEETLDAPIAVRVMSSKKTVVSAPPTPVGILDNRILTSLGSNIQTSLTPVYENDTNTVENELIDNTSHDDCPSCVAKAKSQATTSPVVPPGVLQPVKQPEPTPSFTPEDLKKHMDMLKPVSYTHLTLPTNREV